MVPNVLPGEDNRELHAVYGLRTLETPHPPVFRHFLVYDFKICTTSVVQNMESEVYRINP